MMMLRLFKEMQIQIHDTSKEEPISAQSPVKEIENKSEQISYDMPKSWKFVTNHPIDQILGEPSSKVMTRSLLRNVCNNVAFVSQYEPKNINEAEQDESWMMAMQEELNQFERNKVWTLVSKPKDHTIIGTKWIFRNKNDENGIIVRNKARLVAQGYNQEEGIDYEELRKHMHPLHI